MVDKPVEKAKILLEALPYIMRFRDKIFVIKFGGAAMVAEDLLRSVAEDILMLHLIGVHPVVVHGGGPQIGRQLDRLGIKSEFIHGMRVTSAEAAKVVEQILVGEINKELVALINHHGGRAVGLSGKDGQFITAKKMQFPAKPGETPPDLGYVGEVASVDPRIVHTLVREGFIPIIAPVAGDGNGTASYNINADVAAGKIASALGAEKLLLLSDTDGVKDKSGRFYSRLTARETERRIEDGTIVGGMIPKVQCCINALRGGVNKAHIVDGRVPHAILLEIFTDKGIGTEIHLAGRSERLTGQAIGGESPPDSAGKPGE